MSEEQNFSNPNEETLEPNLTDTPAPENPVAGGEEATSELSPEQLINILEKEISTLKQKLDEQGQQLEAYKNRYIAQVAEFDNFRKRTNKEKEELETKIKGKTIGELLTVVDNFERARNTIKPANDGEMNIHKSYQGVYKTLVDSLKRLGVSAMRPEGQPFDPGYHEAMMREYTDEHPEGTVIEQLVRGYTLGDRILRHALVKVAAPASADPNADDRESSGVDN